VWDTSSVTLREENRSRVFENRVHKMEEVGLTREWRKSHNDELHNLYFSLEIITVIKSRRMTWAGHVARMRVIINAYKMLAGNIKERKRPLRKHRCRWKDTITVDLK
jgi:hypothetical protein